MAATARVVVLMEPEEKALLEAQAKTAGKSLGAYMRGRALGTENDDLDQLLELVGASTARASAALDHALAGTEALLCEQASREELARERARAEFKDLDPVRLAQLLGAGIAPPAATARPRPAVRRAR